MQYSLAMNTSAFLELCRLRRSVRKFSDRPVERGKLELCLESARLAPSADNFQPWRFLVFDDPEKKQSLARVVFSSIYAVTRPLATAPVLVCLLIKENIVVNRLARLALGTQLQYVDAGIAGEHFALACAEQGLGTCWIGWFNARALTRYLGLKGKGFRPICLFAVGYPAEDWKPREPKRKPLSDIAFWNSPPR